jgi:integrase
MADLSDPQRYGQKLTNQLEKLASADIAEDDRDAIQAFVRHLDTRASVNTGTIVSRLNRLRLTAERSDVRLVDADLEAVESFVFDLKHDRGLAEGTVRNYRKALRAFYRWRDEPWAEEIHIGASPSNSVDSTELLDMDDINLLLEMATNPRDTALVALLADSGLRIGAVASLRVRDVSFEGPTASVSVNTDANVKGASGTTPLTWSEGYVANWLDSHPRRDDPDAPLFHVRGPWYDPEDDSDGSLDYQYINRRIKALAEDTDIDASRVNTHNFRKSAISRWIREGMSEQAIKHRAHWDVDTDQIDTYSGVRDEELNDQILAHYGLEAGEESRPDLDDCPRCGTTLSGSEAFCPGCAGALTDRAAARAEETEGDLFDAVAEHPEERMTIGEARERFNSDPEFRAWLSGDHD